MREEKASFMISISQKAGKVRSGEFAAEKAVRDGSAKLLILSEDASENTKKKFQNMAIWHHVPVKIYLDKRTLGLIIGKGERSCAAIIDENLAEEISGLIEQAAAEQSASKK